MGTLNNTTEKKLEQVRQYIRSFAGVIDIYGIDIENPEKGEFEIIDIRTDDRIENGFYQYMHETEYEDNQLLNYIAELFEVDKDYVDYNLYDKDAFVDGTRSHDFKIYIDQDEI